MICATVSLKTLSSNHFEHGFFVRMHYAVLDTRKIEEIESSRLYFNPRSGTPKIQESKISFVRLIGSL